MKYQTIVPTDEEWHGEQFLEMVHKGIRLENPTYLSDSLKILAEAPAAPKDKEGNSQFTVDFSIDVIASLLTSYFNTDDLQQYLNHFTSHKTPSDENDFSCVHLEAATMVANAQINQPETRVEYQTTYTKRLALENKWSYFDTTPS